MNSNPIFAFATRREHPRELNELSQENCESNLKEYRDPCSDADDCQQRHVPEADVKFSYMTVSSNAKKTVESSIK